MSDDNEREDGDTRTNIRRLERQVEANRKESADKHHAVRTELEGVRQEIRAGQKAGQEARVEMHAENKKHLKKQDETLAAHGDKIDLLLKIEADKASARKERERIAQKVGVAFKVLGWVSGAIVGIVGFAKLVFELMKHAKAP